MSILFLTFNSLSYFPVQQAEALCVVQISIFRYVCMLSCVVFYLLCTNGDQWMNNMDFVGVTRKWTYILVIYYEHFIQILWIVKCIKLLPVFEKTKNPLYILQNFTIVYVIRINFNIRENNRNGIKNFTYIFTVFMFKENAKIITHFIHGMPSYQTIINYNNIKYYIIGITL